MLPLPLWALRRRLRSCPAIQSVSYEATDERLRPVVRMAVQAFVRSAARSAFAAAALTAGIAFAGSKTYSGTLDDPGNTALIGSGPAPSAPDFTDEDAIANNVALYAFAVATAQTVEFRSLGFDEGGVDPYFTLFAGSDGTATVVGSNVDQAFSTGGDFDLTFTLASGAYQFALGAFANESFAENGGGTLADGFIGLGETYSLGDGHYRIEVTTSSTTPPSSIPEPATIALWSVAIAAACLARRASHPRRRSRLFPGARETRTMNRAKPSAVAAMMCMTLFGVVIAPTTAAAQTRAALVQNVDEPGRSPYQENVSATCFASCTLTFSAVPAGMRLVVTHVNATVDTIGGGVLPRVVFRSNLFGSKYLFATLPVVRGLSVGSTNQMIVDGDVVAYFGAGEQPVITGDLTVELYTSITDRLAGPSNAMLTGYYVKLP